MTAKRAEKITQLAGETLANELGLLDWQGALDFICDEHDLTANERAKVDAQVQAMVTGIINRL
jgi:hypothetical protein